MSKSTYLHTWLKDDNILPIEVWHTHLVAQRPQDRGAPGDARSLRPLHRLDAEHARDRVHNA